MKASTLADFVIVFVALSAIIVLGSYIGLTWTTKEIPPDMITMGVALASGAVAAGALKNKSQLNTRIRGSLVNYSLMGIAFTQLILVVNYNFLVWAERVIQKELIMSIHGLTTVVLTVTTFRNSGYNKSSFSQHNNRETRMDSTQNK